MSMTFEQAMKHMFHEGLHPNETETEYNERVDASEKLLAGIEAKGYTLETFIIANTPKPKQGIIMPKETPLIEKLLRGNGYIK